MVFWLKIVLIGGSILAAAGLKYAFPQIKDDNPIEEVVEELIEKQTGIDVDITPLSPEKG